MSNPAILYIGFRKGVPLRCRRLDGIRRFAQARGWDVVAMDPDEEKEPRRVREALDRLRPIGCIRECARVRRDLAPGFFAPVPLVCFDPPERSQWRKVATIRCDEAAIAKAAYVELSSGLPPAYAVVSHGPARNMPWARQRVAAFTALCRADGRPGSVFPERRGEDAEARFARLASWVAALPLHCAVFAVSDYAVEDDVARAFAVADRSFPRSATLVGADAAEASGKSGIAADISSVRIDFELSGYLAAKAVAAMVPPCGGRSPGGPTAQIIPGGPFPGVSDATFGPLLVERRKSTRGYGRRASFVPEAVETIRREACEGLTAAALIARSPVSKRLFNLRFREAMGHTVHDEIEHVRLERVFSLLADTELPLGVIADMCGFGSAVELRQIFKARTGLSMTAWRARRR